MSNRLISDYNTLVAALEERRILLKISAADVDAATGKRGFPRTFRAAESLDAVLKLFDAKIALLEVGSPRWKEAKELNELPIRQKLSAWGKCGALKRRRSMTPQQVKSLCSMAGKASAAARAKKQADIARAARLHEPRNAWHAARRKREQAAIAVDNSAP